MIENSATPSDFPGLTNKDALEINRAFIKRWFELQLEEIDKDIQRIESMDIWGQVVLRARWGKSIDLMLAAYGATKKYDTDAGQVELVALTFGDQLGLPASKLYADIKSRLEWYKRRAGAKFERSIKTSINLHRITSPIEQIFLMEWTLFSSEENHGFKLHPQRELQTSEGCYRIDFVVTHGSAPDLNLAIELDGHEFHEKTKKQAAADRKRERTIVREGYTVLRFTGSEIFRNCRQCVNEIIELGKERFP